jgi:hypothetical protein
MLVKTVELVVGLGLFGEPLFVKGMEYLHLNVPEWKEYMDIERFVSPSSAIPVFPAYYLSMHLLTD